MTFIEEFVQKALTERGSFLMNKDGLYISFSQDDVGAAKYILARYNRRNPDVVGLSNLYLDTKIVAIVAYGLVYIVEPYFFDLYPESGSIPTINHMVFFDDICQNAQKQIEEEIFPRLFKQLVVDEITNESELQMCRWRARAALLQGLDFSYDKCDIKLSKNQIAQILCGFSSVEEITENIFEENFEKYKKNKAYMRTVLNFLETADIAEDWERNLAEGVNSVNAKTVTVEFTLNSKTAFAKIDTETLLCLLVNSTTFNDYNFVTTKSGKQLITSLNAVKNGESILKCKHITRIIYSKEVLFKR